MTEQDDNNISADSDGVASRGAQPVCPKCFQSCKPQQYYCANCDSNEPLNPLASYMPFVQIRFEMGVIGKVWRMILNKETSIAMKVFLLLLVLLYVQTILIVGLAFLLISKIKNAELRKTITIAFSALLAVLVIYYLFS